MRLTFFLRSQKLQGDANFVPTFHLRPCCFWASRQFLGLTRETSDEDSIKNRGFRKSRSSQTMALPLTTSEWLDPLADLTNNGPTGLEPLSIDGGVTFRPLASLPFCFVSTPVSLTMTRPLTPRARPPEPLFLHAPRRAPQAICFRHPLAPQAMY